MIKPEVLTLRAKAFSTKHAQDTRKKEKDKNITRMWCDQKGIRFADNKDELETCT